MQFCYINNVTTALQLKCQFHIEYSNKKTLLYSNQNWKIEFSIFAESF